MSILDFSDIPRKCIKKL